jgi:sugar lactone lactonase YvrE
MKNIFPIIAVACISTAGLAQTKRINFTAPYQYPEGVVYNNANGLFYVSSVRTGAIGTVDTAGNYRFFHQDNALKSSYGMKIDPATNRLWVCTGDPNYSNYADSTTYKKLARLIGIDLATGQKAADINLGSLYNGQHFINDLAFDGKGNVYVTDSYSPVIYKVDAKGNATVFTEHELFKAVDIGLNGIVYHPQGYLLVSQGSDGIVLKVPVDQPANISKVKINGFFPGADGLLLDKQNNLVLIQNKGVNKVYQLSSTDNWQTAMVKAATATEDRFQQPSTATFYKNDIYVLNSKINELNDPTKPQSKEFSLQLVRFIPL